MNTVRDATRRKKPVTKKPGVARPIARDDAEKNAAPSQWGRRLARLVGEKFDVAMTDNHSKNEGEWRDQIVAIKCAKSPMPPVSILTDMLDRLDLLWAVYVMPDGHADVWSVEIDFVRRHGYFTRGRNVQKRVEIYLRKLAPHAEKIGTLTPEEVASCRIP